MKTLQFEKLGRTVEFTVPETWQEAVQTFPATTVQYWFEYGVSQSIADGGAIDKETTADEWEGKIKKRFDKLTKGEMSYRKAGSRKSVEERTRLEVTEQFLIATLAAKGKARKDYAKDKWPAMLEYWYTRDQERIDAEVHRRLDLIALTPEADDFDEFLAEVPKAEVPEKKRDTRKSKG